MPSFFFGRTLFITENGHVFDIYPATIQNARVRNSALLNRQEMRRRTNRLPCVLHDKLQDMQAEFMINDEPLVQRSGDGSPDRYYQKKTKDIPQASDRQPIPIRVYAHLLQNGTFPAHELTSYVLLRLAYSMQFCHQTNRGGVSHLQRPF